MASNLLGLTLSGDGILANVYAPQFVDAVDVLGFQDDWSSDPIWGGEDLGGDHIEAVKRGEWGAYFDLWCGNDLGMGIGATVIDKP